MKKVIFWYGSLLSTDGWNKTLKRKITEKDLIFLTLKWYKRTWTNTSLIMFLDTNEVYYWCFLNLKKDDDFFVEWFWVVVNDEEFELIKTREKTYDMIDITDSIVEKKDGYRYYAAYLEKWYDSKWYEKVIPWKYLDFVNKAVAKLWKEFKRKYDNAMCKNDCKIVYWDYKFLDEEINKASWR